MASCSGNGSRGHHKFTLNVNETYVSGGADNYSTVSWSLVLSPIQTGWDWNYSGTVPVSYKITINGTDYTGNIMSYDGRSIVTIRSGTQNVTHNSDGSKSINFSFSVWDVVSASYLPGSASGSGSLTLTKIGRYTSITSFTVSKRNESSLVFNWKTADTIDYLWYSTNNGSSWTGYDVTDGTSGNFTVSGLSPNTTYNCKIRVRRKDSQLTTDSSTVAQTTYKAPSQSLNARTETSIKMNWSCDTNVSKVEYSKDNGSTWTTVTNNANATSGNYTISSLSPNTTYNIKTRLTRSATSTNYATGATAVTTYNYPYCTTAPDFTIGNNVTIGLYNPLNRTVQIQMWSHVSRAFVSDKISVTKTSYTGFSNVASRLYASIPNATESNYNIDVWYGDNKAVKSGGKYKIKGTETPTFSNFTYRDSNTTVTNVTENNQIMVKGLSTVEVTISSANKMVAQNSATGKNYSFTMASLSGTANYSSSDVVKSLGTINAGGTQRLSVTAYDSRNLNKTVYKDITVYDYSKPVINATITRLNNFENETTLKVRGTYNKLTINNTDKNNLTSVQYRYRENGGTWSSWTNFATTVNNGSFTCTDVILNLDNTKSFDFQIRATDSLQQTTTNSYVIDVGKAAFFIKKDGGFEANGDSTVNGTLNIDEKSNINTEGTYTSSLGTSTHINGNRGKAIINSTNPGGNSYTMLAKMNSENGVWTLGSWTQTFNLFYTDNSVIRAGTNAVTKRLVLLNESGDAIFPGNLNAITFNNYVLANACSRTVRTATSKTHTNYGTNNNNVPDMSFLAFWNGAYNGNNASNLTYAHEGTIQCKPISLYDNSSGTTGTVTLSQTAANFTYLEIFYGADGRYNSMRIYSPNNKTFSTHFGYNGKDNDRLIYLYGNECAISGTQITQSYARNIAITTNNTINNYGNNLYVKIYKVLGYK